MSRKRIPGLSLKLVGVVLIGLLVAAMVGGLYYYSHVSNQEAYHVKRNFRLVGAISKQLGSTVESYVSVLNSAATKVVEKNNQQLFGNSSDLTKADNQLAQYQELKSTVELATTLKLVSSGGATGELFFPQTSHPGPSEITESNKAHPPEEQAAGANPQSAASGLRLVKPVVTPRFKRDDEGVWLYLDYRAEVVGDQLKRPLEMRFQARDKLKQILALELSQDAFDDVLLADKDGRVVFQRSELGENLLNLSSLEDDQGRRLELELSDTTSGDKSQSAGREGSHELNLSSSLLDVKLAGGSYKMFVQPFRVLFRPEARTGAPSLASSQQDEQILLVCGIVSSNRFLFRALSVSYSVRLFVVFLVLMGLLLAPVLKVGLMGPEDRLRSFDVYALFASILACSALLAFLMLDLAVYAKSQNESSRQLEVYADKLATNFEAELIDAHRQLRKMDRDLPKILACKSTEDSINASRPEEPREGPAGSDLTDILSAEGPKRSGSPLACCFDSLSYPYFESAGWIDGEGTQRFKWSTRQNTTRHSVVKDRGYFLDIMSNPRKTWPIERNGGTATEEFALDRVISRNTGQNTTVLSIRSESRVPLSETGERKIEVAYLDYKPVSLTGTVLPPGFGFALIDNSGEVKYHSDEIRNLKENLFEECDDNTEMRGAVLSRVAYGMSGKYLGRNNRFFIRPIKAPPWTLVVFRDAEWMGALNLSALCVATTLLLLNAGSLLVVFIFAYQKDWIWPCPKKAASYSRLFALNIAWSVIFMISISFMRSGEAVLLFAFMVPALAMITLHHELRWRLVSKLARMKVPHLFRLLSRFRRACRKYSDGSFYETKAMLSLLAVSPAIILFKTGAALRPLVLKPTGRRRNWLKREERRRNSSDSGLNYGYRRCVASLLVLMGVMPAIAFFDIAYRFETKRFVRLAQVEMARRLEDRETKIRKRYSDVSLKDRAAFLTTRLELGESARDVYLDSFFGTTAQWVEPEENSAVLPDSPDLINRIANVAPIFTPSSAELHRVIGSRASDSSWYWIETRSGELLLKKQPAAVEIQTTPWGKRADLSLSSQIHGDSLVAAWRWTLPFLFFLTMGPLVRFLSRRLFFLDLEQLREGTLEQLRLGTLDHHVLLLRTRYASVRRYLLHPKVHTIDIRGIATASDWGEAYRLSDLPRHKSIIAIDHFEYDLYNPSASLQKLRLLQRLLTYGRILVVVSGAYPTSFALPSPEDVGHDSAKDKPDGGESTDRDGTGSDCPTESSERLREQWKICMQTFFRVHPADRPRTDYLKRIPASRRKELEILCLASIHARDPRRSRTATGAYLARGRVEAALRTVRAECKHRRYLRLVGRQLLACREFPNMTSDQIVQYVLARARQYYSAVWGLCSHREKLLLYHLAQDGLAQSKNVDLLSLRARGLVVKRPHLELMNQSFRQFVLAESRPHHVRSWSKGRTTSVWTRWRVPLATGLIGIAIFFFFTQRDAYNQTIAFLTAGVPALLRLLGFVTGRTFGGK